MKAYIFNVAFCSIFGLTTMAQGPMNHTVNNNRPNKIHYTIKKSNLSSDNHTDFGVYPNNGKLYFLSDRKSWPVEWTDETDQPFLDLFVMDVKTGKKAQFAGPKKNGRFNEGPICFTKDGKRVYYTRDYDGKKGNVASDGTINLGIFTAKVKDDKWIEEKQLSVNDLNYSVGHPVLSNDGKFLIFSSNMPGGKGGSDIYRAPIMENGDVGKPEPIPGEVNTAGHELFPAVGSNDELYFSSTSHESMGGLDIFMALYKGDTYTRITSVGHPINSENDDFAYSPGSSSKGYFSTNRDGSDDIYSFDQVIPFRFTPLLSGNIALEDVEDKAGVLVEVMDENKKVISSQLTDEKGNYSLDLEEEKQFLVRYTKEGYDAEVIKVSTKGDGFGLKNDFVMKKDNGIEVTLQLFAAKTGLAVEGALVSIIDNQTNRTFLRELSDPEGYVSEPMLDLKEGDSLDLTVKIAKEGYLTKEVRFTHTVTSMQDVMLHELYGNALKMNRVGIELGIDISSVIDVEPLPFKEGSADVKYEVMVELDKIVAFMVENPTISIRLRSHTGSRGSSRDNLDLSSRRAKAAVEYIVAQGIRSSRISGVGVGEKEIINHCRDGVDCTEGEHRENERTQYIITKN